MLQEACASVSQGVRPLSLATLIGQVQEVGHIKIENLLHNALE